MATTHVSHPAGWRDAVAIRIDLIERLWTGFQSRRARRETVRQLHSVDSATLRELGISPEEIEGLVYGRHDDLVRRYVPDWWRK
jgi:uncharacterized protein YjiS (DUF1127 family)